jgi:hypothetical protein
MVCKRRPTDRLIVSNEYQSAFLRHNFRPSLPSLVFSCFLHARCDCPEVLSGILNPANQVAPKAGVYPVNVSLHRINNYGNEVLQFLKFSALKPMRTSIRSPWQNGVAERWVGSARRELPRPHHPAERVSSSPILGATTLLTITKTELTLA